MNISEYIKQHKDRFISELTDFLKIPSISSNSEHQLDMLKAAEYLQNQFKEIGIQSTEILETEGHPVVFAEKIIDPNLPTILVYGHYDVQPVDPLDLWEDPPFEPTIKSTDIHPEGAIFARGACDDKGQSFMYLKACEYMIKHDQLACNIKFILEGEEEIGSPNLESFIKTHQDKLSCDVIVISDTDMAQKNQPAITTSLRGLSYMEVTVKEAYRDLHSGLYGGIVANPINVLCNMISQLKDAHNKVTIPKFYDEVLELTEEEKNVMYQKSEEHYKQELGITTLTGETEYNLNERVGCRPSLDVNGIWGGFTDEGAKTVIPSEAYAKISMRLVANQNWETISQQFEQHFKTLAPDGVKVSVKTFHGGAPYNVSMEEKGYQAAAKALEKAFGILPVSIRGGGSIPILSILEQHLNSKCILMGFGLSSDAIHAPNEHFGIDNFLKGIETIPHFFQKYKESHSK